jgi:hypothetical protein
VRCCAAALCHLSLFHRAGQPPRHVGVLRAGPPWEGEEEAGGRWGRGRRDRKGGRRQGWGGGK